ncbi:patatin family protein [Vibrio sp. SCSIO 43132]|uniref:patatin-like phospholipase family protein n=1 Tax=Vibrio sp. SCSIO 43132 TaxID=2779363 RepID=UPI001CA923FF|nr:patatin family protein [Vibrio sp. SCSIO 43132]UAB73803.1 patatin family protein [Vibrio sp. SCSIO 43132]
MAELSEISGNRALIVEGGAMRGIFASGVLDAFLIDDFMPYDFAIGVSAGASNLIGYLAKLPKRSQRVITELATQKRFFNPTRFVRGGDLVDVKWLWEQANALYPVDEELLFSSIPMFAAVTNAVTGNADYYRIKPTNIADVMEATSALPIAYRTTPCFSGGCYTDGGVADSIPVREAYRRGARDITVILSHPLSYNMPEMKFPKLMDQLLKRYPNIAEAMKQRAKNYNASLDFIRQPPKGCVVRVIAPDEHFKVGRFTMRKSTLLAGYEMGIEAGKEHMKKRSGVFGLSEEDCHFCV